jgi:hypothetical protein
MSLSLGPAPHSGPRTGIAADSWMTQIPSLFKKQCNQLRRAHTPWKNRMVEVPRKAANSICLKNY